MADERSCKDCRYFDDCSSNMTDAVWDRAYERRHGRDCWRPSGFIAAPMTRQQVLVLQKVFRRMRKLGIKPVEREQIILQLNKEVEELRKKLKDLETRPLPAPETPTVFYFCDKRACDRCLPYSKAVCRHTADVRHAKNFYLCGDAFMEQERADE